jgi:hypothetical protein
MNNYKQTLMHTPDEFITEEFPGRTKRRLLVIGLFLSYVACLATMWYIWNAPRQAFDTFWLSFAQSRFTLIILPILILCGFYLSLHHIAGDIIGWGVKNLDERQRMVWDQAHRSAYKIIALLCLLMPLYLILQNMLTSPLSSSISYDVRLNPVQKMTLMQFQKSNGIILWTLQTVYPAQEQSIFIARNAALNQGIYYCLFLLILALIVWTLPRAIIAWKERA